MAAETLHGRCCGRATLRFEQWTRLAADFDQVGIERPGAIAFEVERDEAEAQGFEDFHSRVSADRSTNFVHGVGRLPLVQ